jgi:uncharacterized protein (DUF1015 family)
VGRFRPFRGIRYNARRIDSFETVVAPPYDVISPEQRDALYESGPYNSARLILNRESHAEAARLFRAWLADRVLERDEAPCFYLYAQDFDSEEAKRRTGVIGALYLEPFSTGVVRPHEQTFAHHKKDRLALTTAVKANLSPIFGLYSNAEFKPEPDGGWNAPADIDVVQAGVRNRVWVVRDSGNVESIRAAVDGRTIFIADGHHRYATALNYYDQIRPGIPLDTQGAGASDDEEPAAHVLAFLAAFEDPGMVILPTHRQVVRSGGVDWRAFAGALADRFSVSRFGDDAAGRAALLDALAHARSDVNAFGLAIAGTSELLFLERPAPLRSDGDSPLGSLDVTVLHSTILGEMLSAAGAGDVELAYSADGAAVIETVAAGNIEAAFLMRATRADQLADVCMAGDLMPQKSTYFYPKLLTGLVFHSLER